MIGSLVSAPQWCGSKVWGVVTRVENPILADTVGTASGAVGLHVRVHWFQPDIQQAHGHRWWHPSGLDFVTLARPSSKGEGNVAEDIKRKS